jgi:LmbE family N-acetylglucosaminyl deacetylase
MMSRARERLRALVGALFLTAVLAPRPAFGQERGAAALDQLLRGVTVSGRVLMVAAHPDDEDTNLLAQLARGHQVHAAYLSLTRGDGGQNLIGNELGEALGAIRTEELLAARRVDGSQQFFSRAYDFGFSKSADETFTQWDRESITGDVVRVIRAFRPQVMVAVFSGTPLDGHGHHQASGILARDGFDAAMDTVRFPVATHGRPWQPLKFYRGAWARNRPFTLAMEVGGYDAVLGRSPAEIAGESRSQHRSQGFGVIQRRGAAQTRLTREVTRVNESTPAEQEKSIFDGVDTSFAHLTRIAGGRGAALAKIPTLMDSLQRVVDLRRPSALAPALAQVVMMAEAARLNVKRCGLVPLTDYPTITGPPAVCDLEDVELETALIRITDRAKRALVQASGVLIEATANSEIVAFGEPLIVKVSVYNRGTQTVRLHGIEMSGTRPRALSAPIELAAGRDTVLEYPVLALVDHRPYWVGTREKAMFRDAVSPADGIARVSSGVTVEQVPRVSVPDDVRRLSAVAATLEIAGVTTEIDAGTIVYRFADPVLGEQNRPAAGVPPITIALDRTLEYVRADAPLDRRIRITVRSYQTLPRTIRFRTLIPAGVRGAGLPDSMVIAPGATHELYLTLTGRLAAGKHDFGVGVESEGTIFIEGFSTIEYPHIRPIRIYRQSSAYLLAVPVNVPRALRVAYITGVSDAIAPVLSQLQIPTTVLTADQLPYLDLGLYTTLVIGPRAYETSADLRAANPRLFEWVRNGGTLVVQYGQFEMQLPGMMPQPIAFSRPAARVTMENAAVRVLDANSRLLRWPNRIGATDWAEWVQERALYMPSVIDPAYRTPLSLNDPDEPEQRGAILDLPMGKGRYIYTSLSLFRQIPGGVPGGTRLLVNLMSANLPEEARAP